MYSISRKNKLKSSPIASFGANEIEVRLETTENDCGERQEETKSLSKTNSPTIINNTQYPIVVFLERGIFYNEQVLHPGEAVMMTRKQTGGGKVKVPFKVHAMIGDENALPSKADSMKNIAKISAVPAAFAAGCLLAAMSAGTLAGPSAALAPLVNGLVVKGVVIDAAAITAGTMAADGTKKLSEALLKHHKETLMSATSLLRPRERYLSVTGGLLEGPVVIQEIPRHTFERMAIETIKSPLKRAAKERREEMDALGEKEILEEPFVKVPERMQ